MEDKLWFFSHFPYSDCPVVHSSTDWPLPVHTVNGRHTVLVAKPRKHTVNQNSVKKSYTCSMYVLHVLTLSTCSLICMYYACMYCACTLSIRSSKELTLHTLALYYTYDIATTVNVLVPVDYWLTVFLHRPFHQDSTLSQSYQKSSWTAHECLSGRLNPTKTCSY